MSISLVIYMSDISKSIKKVDSDEKSIGKASYVSDIKMPGMLYAKTLRSPYPKANIISRKYPSLEDGYFIIDYNDIPGKNFVKIIFEDMPVFAVSEVTYYQEPILLIVGPNKLKVSELISYHNN